MTSVDTPEIDVDQLAVGRAVGVVLDVRERAEFVEGHVPGAVLVPMGQLPARMGDLDRDRNIYVICASGNRSSAMTDLLRDAGFEAVSVAGGTNAWVESGRPVERGLS